MRNITQYYTPTSLAEARTHYRQAGGQGRFIAGGTRLVAQHDQNLEALIDLTGCGLNGIREEAEYLHIGACMTLEELRRAEKTQRFAGGIVAEVAGWNGSLQLRNASTLGGNLVSHSELVLPLVACDADVVLMGDTERTIALKDWHAGHASLQDGEILTACRLPLPLKEAAGCALRMSRTRQAVPIIAVAVVLLCNGETCNSARIAVQPTTSGVARFPEAEALLCGQTLSQELIEHAAEAVAAAMQPCDDYRASAAYRQKMSRVYVKRALSHCVGTTAN